MPQCICHAAFSIWAIGVRIVVRIQFLHFLRHISICLISYAIQMLPASPVHGGNTNTNNAANAYDNTNWTDAAIYIHVSNWIIPNKII